MELVKLADEHAEWMGAELSNLRQLVSELVDELARTVAENNRLDAENRRLREDVKLVPPVVLMARDAQRSAGDHGSHCSCESCVDMRRHASGPENHVSQTITEQPKTTLCPQCVRYAAERVDLVSQIAAHTQAYKEAVEERDMWHSTAKHEIEQTTLARLERDRALEQVKALEDALWHIACVVCERLEWVSAEDGIGTYLTCIDRKAQHLCARCEAAAALSNNSTPEDQPEPYKAWGGDINPEMQRRGYQYTKTPVREDVDA